MEIKGIDVSHWQGKIDWAKVAQDGVRFAVLKIGGSDAGRYRDKSFESNFSGAKANGIKVGGYYFNGAGCTSANAGIADAQHCLSLISGKAFDYPVYSDLEAPTRATRQGNTDAVIAFCQTIANAGYKTGIYASDISGFKDRLDITRLNAYDKWVARYGSTPKYVTNYQLWQYTSSGAVKGINGRVDMDISYFDYAPTPVEPSYFYMGVDFSPVFNPNYYDGVQASPDSPDTLGDVYKHDPSALWLHFTTFGMNEFRQASEEFNPQVYYDRYEDLRKTFGDNRPLYYWHYCYFGKAEGRSAT